ncbi:hypothetical protein P8452_18897 [Trifolium repens]|jgi:hypothetical protein|nr:F-box/RNI superfamily protein [Trifolium repens]WJX30345.1 hypothetical protein P8452_18897 [Trifolium repens]
MAKRQKLEAEDNLSSLPECLLAAILSLIPTKETALTSLISTTWKYHWKKLLTVDISNNGMLGVQRFMEFVNSDLGLREGFPIHKLTFECSSLDHKVCNNSFKMWFPLIVPTLEELELKLFSNEAFQLPCCISVAKNLVSLRYM